MKTSFKVALASAGALMLAATSAMAVDVPSNGNGGLLLVVRDLSDSSRVFTADTGLTVDSILTQAAITSGPAANGLPITGIATNFADISNAALGTFLGVTSALGYEYALIGGDSDGNAARATAARFVSTGEIQFAGTTLSSLTSTQIYGASGLFASGGEQFFIDFNQESAAAGGSSSVTTLGLGVAPGDVPNLWGIFNPDVFAAVGTATNLYVFTSSGSANGKALVYQANDIKLLSSGTLLGGGAANVPVPAAIWLLGSGLAGMGAISRRRKLAVTAA